jgi:hypothetical protein
MNRTRRISTTAFVLLMACAFSAAAQAPPNGQHSWQHGQHPNGTPPIGAPQNGAAMTAKPPAATGVPQPASAYSTVPVKKTETGEQFFIVASLDLQKQQLLLKYPTEVTLLVKATDQTKFVDDSGNSLKLSDLRAGDTVWVTSGKGSDGAVALKVRKGQMTVADLHHYYLDFAEIK